VLQTNGEVYNVLNDISQLSLKCMERHEGCVLYVVSELPNYDSLGIETHGSVECLSLN